MYGVHEMCQKHFTNAVFVYPSPTCKYDTDFNLAVGRQTVKPPNFPAIRYDIDVAKCLSVLHLWVRYSILDLRYVLNHLCDIVFCLCVCSAEELHSYLGETEGLILVDRYVSELPLVRNNIDLPL